MQHKLQYCERARRMAFGSKKVNSIIISSDDTIIHCRIGSIPGMTNSGAALSDYLNAGTMRCRPYVGDVSTDETVYRKPKAGKPISYFNAGDLLTVGEQFQPVSPSRTCQFGSVVANYHQSE